MGYIFGKEATSDKLSLKVLLQTVCNAALLCRGLMKCFHPGVLFYTAAMAHGVLMGHIPLLFRLVVRLALKSNFEIN